MSQLLGPDGEPLNPAAYFQLVPDEEIDRLYDTFDTDAPIWWQIEWNGARHFLVVFGWVCEPTEDGYAFWQFTKAELPVKVPEGYAHVDDRIEGATIQ